MKMSFLNRCGLLAAICLLVCPVFSAAQSTAVEIETLLDTKVVTYAQAARFVLEAADVKKTANPQEAFDYAVERKWLPRNTAIDDPAKLAGISLLLMRSFDIRGGLFYTLFKNPHYAYRELVNIDVIQGRHAPGMTVSGERLLFYVNRVLASQEWAAAERRRLED
jgi:hypothetical protein